MPRLRAPLTAALLAFLSLAAVAPAAAGGPTSALLSVPGEGRTASLYMTDPEYDELARLVGADGSSVTGKVDDSGRGHEDGPGITVTWLVHDVSPWRIDRIYLSGEGAPWVATQTSFDPGKVFGGPVVWHQPESGKALVALMDELGLGPSGGPAKGADSVGQSAAEPATTIVDDNGAPDSPSTTSVWLAGLAGVLAGVLVGAFAMLVGTRVRGRRTTGPAIRLRTAADSSAQPR